VLHHFVQDTPSVPCQQWGLTRMAATRLSGTACSPVGQDPVDRSRLFEYSGVREKADTSILEASVLSDTRPGSEDCFQ
jgi:hypothetical protein